MSKIKDSVPEYILEDPIELEKYAFKLEIEELIAKGCFEDKTLLREFLEDVTPLAGPNYFIFASDDNGNVHNFYLPREEYIDALCCLSQYQYTLFFHIASFTKWIENRYATAVRCLYVDIDDIGMKADKTSYEDAVSFLKETYNLTDEQMPNYLSLSGNGMHVAWKINELTAEDEKLRDLYTKSLLVHLSGDWAGRPVSHMFRCPTSYNMKEAPIKGKLFKVNDSPDRDIHRLDWCLKDEVEIETHRSEYFKKRSEKAKITAEKNRQAQQELLDKLGDTTIEEFLARKDIADEERAIAKKIFARQSKIKLSNDICNMDDEDFDISLYYDTPLPYTHLEFYSNYTPSNRYSNLLMDLHNFFIRHKGCLVSRYMYFFILANILKISNHDEDYAIRYCYKYTDSEYNDKMESIIKTVFSLKKTYRYKNTTIADILCFTNEDIEQSHCNFSDEIRIRRKAEANKRQYEKTKAKNGKTPAKLKKEKQLEFIRENPNASPAEIMKILNISRATAYRLKNPVKTVSKN